MNKILIKTVSKSTLIKASRINNTTQSFKVQKKPRKPFIKNLELLPKTIWRSLPVIRTNHKPKCSEKHVHVKSVLKLSKDFDYERVLNKSARSI